MNCVALKNSDL